MHEGIVNNKLNGDYFEVDDIPSCKDEARVASCTIPHVVMWYGWHVVVGTTCTSCVAIFGLFLIDNSATSIHGQTRKREQQSSEWLFDNEHSWTDIRKRSSKTVSDLRYRRIFHTSTVVVH